MNQMIEKWGSPPTKPIITYKGPRLILQQQIQPQPQVQLPQQHQAPPSYEQQLRLQLEQYQGLIALRLDLRQHQMHLQQHHERFKLLRAQRHRIYQLRLQQYGNIRAINRANNHANNRDNNPRDNQDQNNDL